jgi:predicted DNA-binding transcriptional regulator YafY
MTRAAIPQHRYGRLESMIESAITAEDVLIFSYPSSEDGNPKTRRLSPYLIERDAAREIVKGWDHDAEAIRRYALANIVGAVEVALAEEYVQPT